MKNKRIEYKFKQNGMVYRIDPTVMSMYSLWVQKENSERCTSIIGGGQNTFEGGCPHCQVLMTELMRLEGEKDK